MNDAQTWTVIGSLVTLILAFMALMVRTFGHTLDARFDALTTLVTVRFEQVDQRFEQIDRRFEQVDRCFEHVEKRLDRIEHRVDNLDRDVTAITRRLMGGAEG
ncbi:hypothetical protein D9V41_06765 [Aeromicrobium phragmitis]|uniref:Uncharacterized protein n=1 Tax=Aeromicrobium phragmitis TaxID=2478914 RepID=A0A3L8PNP4_9ACTN|nr:hypothetical protein [Aeromicrobium phragmitis]RLV56138.1 hypothetical protein D9V41_06765 [Aeromicrobium phragmitis]